MNRYTIYCTEEQTKKAHELSAPLYQQTIDDDGKAIEVIDDEIYIYYAIPTAEQVLGWLEEQGLAIDIIRDNTCYRASVWRNESLDDGWDFYKENEVEKFSRKEATLAAIDAALDYLIKNKK